MKGSGPEAGSYENLRIRMLEAQIRNTAHVNVCCYLGADPPTGRHTAAALLCTDYSRLHPARNHMRLKLRVSESFDTDPDPAFLAENRSRSTVF